MMLRFITCFFIVLFSIPASFGQKKKPWNSSIYDEKAVHFGFTIGLNTMDFNIDNSFIEDTATNMIYNADLYSLQPGFNVQIITSYRLGEYFNIRFLPGMSFGQRQLDIKVRENNSTGTSDSMAYSNVINSNIIIFPLLLKYRAVRINNFAPYMIGGFSFMYDMASRKKYPADEEVYVMLNPMDLNYEIGVGADFYLPYFKLGIELKLSQGMFNMLNNTDPATNSQYVHSIDGIKSTMYMLSFHFE